MNKPIPKLCGIETEYAISMRNAQGGNSFGCTSHQATRLVREQIELFPQAYYSLLGEWTISGARCYEDHFHLEWSTPSTVSARRLVALVKAGDAVVNEARARASEQGHDIIIVANNTDGQVSYGSHLNILLARETFDQLFDYRPHIFYRVWVPHLVTSMVYAGAGTICTATRDRQAQYQLSQRAAFMETARIHEITTSRRSLINSRDEALADPERYARLHIISFDSNMHEFALWLKIGTSQLIMSMLECCFQPIDLTLRNPISAIREIARDPKLRTKVELQDGRSLTAIEIQEEIATMASRFVEAGYDEGSVPDASQIVSAWLDTLDKLRRDPNECVGRVDWIAKASLLSMHRRKSGVGWDDPSMKVLDHMYANIDPAIGLYHTVFLRNNIAERVVTDDEIASYMSKAPDDSRAWLRTRCIERFGDSITRMDWRYIDFRNKQQFDSGSVRLNMDDPFEYTCSELESIFDSVSSLAEFLSHFPTVNAPSEMYNSFDPYPLYDDNTSYYDYYNNNNWRY